MNRFDPDCGWIERGLYPKRKDKERHWVRYWASIRARACELLGKNRNEIQVGYDYAITEIVHCKSRDELGVKEATSICGDRYFQRILDVSNAKVIVVLGKLAENWIRLTYKIGEKRIEMLDDGNLVVFLPHPNSRGKKKIRSILSGDQITQIQGAFNQ